MNRFKSLTFSLAFLCSALIAYQGLNTRFLQAKEVEGIFELSVVVTDKRSSTRKRAISLALSELIVKISGQSSAATNLYFKSKLRNSTAYIQRYLYREVEDLDEEGNLVNEINLDLVFDESTIRNLLTEANLPRWGSNRPQILIWLTVGDQHQRFLLGTDEESLLEQINRPKSEDSANDFNQDIARDSSKHPEEIPTELAPLNLKQIIIDKAVSRGLPILLPLMDLEDSFNIDAGDIWGRFITPIRKASSRYNSDAIAAAQVMRTDEGWTTQWLILHEERIITWELQSDSLESAVNDGIDSITDRIAQQYAVFEDSMLQNNLLISVSDIHEVDDLVGVQNYLKSITSIKNVNIAKITGSVIHLRIDTIGKQSALMQAIALNNQLSIDNSPSIQAGSISSQFPSLFFRWNISSLQE